MSTTIRSPLTADPWSLPPSSLDSLRMPGSAARRGLVGLWSRSPEVGALDLEPVPAIEPLLEEPVLADSFPLRQSWERIEGATDPEISYAVDEHDVIVGVGGSWATAGGPAEAAVLGTSLWTHLSDPVLVGLQREIVANVRSRGRGVALRYRCDTAELRRTMLLHVEPLEDGGVLFHSQVVQEQRRPRVKLLERSGDREDAVLSCSWCQRVDVAGWWLDVEDADRYFADIGARPGLRHALCPGCEEELFRQLV